jgi:hypothetical protein
MVWKLDGAGDQRKATISWNFDDDWFVKRRRFVF